jgi:hypothetical protein
MLPEECDHLLGHRKRTPEVELEHLSDHIFGHGLHLPAWTDAGIVEHNIDPPEMVSSLVRFACDVGVLRDVQWQNKNPGGGVMTSKGFNYT